jgi:hypothetical protein
MPHRSDPYFLTLHALKLKGFAESGIVAELTGLSAAEVEGHLAAAQVEGLAQHREGRVSGWALTGDGRARHRELLDADLEGAGCRELLSANYSGFAPLNGRFKQTCTDWQIRSVGGAQVPNKHDDPSYDRRVVDALRQIHVDVEPICVALGGGLARMGSYHPRLSGALARIEGGDRDSFTKPLANSYHDIWMELHEDLLASLKLARTTADV